MKFVFAPEERDIYSYECTRKYLAPSGARPGSGTIGEQAKAIVLVRNSPVSYWFSVADRLDFVWVRGSYFTNRQKSDPRIDTNRLDSPLASCGLVDRPYGEIEKIHESTRRLSFITANVRRGDILRNCYGASE